MTTEALPGAVPSFSPRERASAPRMMYPSPTKRGAGAAIENQREARGGRVRKSPPWPPHRITRARKHQENPHFSAAPSWSRPACPCSESTGTGDVSFLLGLTACCGIQFACCPANACPLLALANRGRRAHTPDATCQRQISASKVQSTSNCAENSVEGQDKYSALTAHNHDFPSHRNRNLDFSEPELVRQQRTPVSIVLACSSPLRQAPGRRATQGRKKIPRIISSDPLVQGGLAASHDRFLSSSPNPDSPLVFSKAKPSPRLSRP